MKPILFNADMIQAILEGRKNETRRPIIPQPTGGIVSMSALGWRDEKGRPLRAPYRPGDVLYVRETWAKEYDRIYYKADGYPTLRLYNEEDLKWRPSIHMPKEYARIFLKVQSIGIQRLTQIHEIMAENEGFIGHWYRDYANGREYFVSAKDKFYEQWGAIYGKGPYSLQEDPLVWVIGFWYLSKICSYKEAELEERLGRGRNT